MFTVFRTISFLSSSVAAYICVISPCHLVANDNVLALIGNVNTLIFIHKNLLKFHKNIEAEIGEILKIC